MAAATAAERHAARARTAPRVGGGGFSRRISGPTVRPRAGWVGTDSRVGTGVFERIRALPDHRVIDRLLRGRVWICFVGVALMGIVAMQVSLLKLNSGISRAVETSATLERQNSGMEASIARLASGERIRAGADKRGMVTPAAGAVRYVRVREGDDAERALRRMRSPSDAAKELMANHGVVPGSLMAPAVPETSTATAAPEGTAAATPAPTPAATAAPPADTTTGTTPAPVPTAAPQATAAPTTGGTTTPTAAPVG
jgi:hypothetical protein